MDPIASINPKKDTTLAMICAAKDKGWKALHVEPKDLMISDGKICAYGEEITHASLTEKNYYQLGETQHYVLDDIDVVMMRKDPPFDMAYVYTSYLLEQAAHKGVLVVNRPDSIRDCNEKLFATDFNDLTPDLCVSSNMQALRKFVEEQGQAILKPLDGMGGASIFKTSATDPNLSVILETLTEHGQNMIMGQEYLPEIKEGDKRILMLNGEAVSHCLARIPKSGETRGNLAAGGSGRVQALSETDWHIANTVGPVLKEKGIIFAGLNIIGTKLTEINVTSPTCLREISKETGIPIAANLMDIIEVQLKK